MNYKTNGTMNQGDRLLASLLFCEGIQTRVKDCALHYGHELCYTLDTLDTIEVIHGFS